jgi:hypothetical protein
LGGIDLPRSCRLGKDRRAPNPPFHLQHETAFTALNRRSYPYSDPVRDRSATIVIGPDRTELTARQRLLTPRTRRRYETGNLLEKIPEANHLDRRRTQHPANVGSKHDSWR